MKLSPKKARTTQISYAQQSLDINREKKQTTNMVEKEEERGFKKGGRE